MALTDRARNWKDRPCHFTWELNTCNRVSYEKIVGNIDSDLEITTNMFTAGNLLFRAYLEVSNRSYHYDVRKAREFLDKADVYIQRSAQLDFCTGFKSVALLNRMWIEQKSLNERKVNSLLAELNDLELTERDVCVIDTLKASCLTRLGPPEIDTALGLFEAALEHFPNCPDFLFGASLMTGRLMRYNRTPGAGYDKLDQVGKSLMNKERSYCEKLMRANDEYQLGRSFLGQNFKGRGKLYQDPARFHLEKAFELAPKVRANFNNLIRFYRYHDKEKAIRALMDNIGNWPYTRVAESHFQLALCYTRKLESNFPQTQISKQNFRRAALNELDKCLELDEMHLFALTTKLDLLTKCGHIQKARQLYEDKLQQSEILTPEDRFHLFYCYAKFLDFTKSPSRIDTWQRVMEISTQLQYQDRSSGKWKVADKIKSERDKTYKKLLIYYQREEDVELQLGILYLQKFEFAKAEEALGHLDHKSSVEIPMYLAEIRLKWGCEVEVRFHLGLCQPDEATRLFRLARENVVTASKMRHFDETQGRKLLADIALWTAHNQLISAGVATPRSQSAQPELLRRSCLDAYREAVRCGSLVASSKLLRLIQKGHLKTVSRSKYIKILAEIDICCSRDASTYLHTEYNPLTFEGGLTSRHTDSNQMGMDCDTINQGIADILSQDEFYSDAWKEYFDMESKILQEDPRSTSITLMLSEEGVNSVKWSDGVVKAAVDCCEKARPLLDHIVVKFQMEELKFSEERKKQYFPLKKEADRTKLEKELTKSLNSTFEVDLRTHYPRLYNYILQIQPGVNPQYECLLSLCEIVGKSKHASRRAENLLSLVEDPVKLARQSMDKVEEICNFFLHTMKDSMELGNKVSELVSDLKSGSHEKADGLLTILKENDDFVCRMKSTWKFLEMLALVQRSRTHSVLSGDPDGVGIKLAEGAWDMSKKLRRSHLAVEVALLETADPSSNEVQEKCRSTCKEINDLLKTVMETKKKNCQDGKVVKFPLKDLHPGVDSLTTQGSDHWEGKVNKQLRIDIKRMGISPDNNLIKSVLKLQPCTNEENYQFLAMRQLAHQMCNDVDAVKDTVSIQTDIPDTRAYRVVDLMRWCTDNAVKIAAEINELTPKVLF